MTKKDYVLIAKVFNNEIKSSTAQAWCYGGDAIELIAKSLAEALSEQNPRFVSEKFLTACGINN